MYQHYRLHFSLSLWISVIYLVVFMQSDALGADKNSACNAIRTLAVNFSNNKVKDTLKLVISGKTCKKAVLSLEIRSNNDKLIYQYKATFWEHLEAEDYSNKSATYMLKQVMGAFLYKPSFYSSKELKKWDPNNKHYIDRHDKARIKRDYYTKIRASNYNVYSHPAKGPGWKAITFDQQRKITVTILTGSL